MYRELAPEGVPFGLQTGPYSGLPRELRVAELPAPVRTRLAAALDQRGSPAPILRKSRDPGPGRKPAVAATALAIGGLGLSATHGYGQTPGFYQGTGWLALDIALGVVALAGVAGLASGGRQLPQRGTFLLPLDVVEIDGDLIRLTPLGGLRRATIEHKDGRISLALRFVHGAEHSFPVGSEQKAERAYAKLEEAQEQMEALTERLDLARALDLDPFFSVRGESEWTQKRDPRRRIAVGAAVLVAGTLVGTAVRGIRNEGSATQAFESIGTEQPDKQLRERYQGFLSEGRGLRREETEGAIKILDERIRIDDWEKQQAIEQRIYDRKTYFRSAQAMVPDKELDPDFQQARRATQERGLKAFRARAASPEIVAVIEQFFAVARERGGNELNVAFSWAGKAPHKDLWPQIDEAQRATERALQRALDPFFTYGVLHVASGGEANRPQARLDIRYEKLPTEKDLGCVISVRFGVPSGAKPVSFELVKKPPKARSPLDEIGMIPAQNWPLKPPFLPNPELRVSVEAQLQLSQCFDQLDEQLEGFFLKQDPSLAQAKPLEVKPFREAVEKSPPEPSDAEPAGPRKPTEPADPAEPSENAGRATH